MFESIVSVFFLTVEPPLISHDNLRSHKVVMNESICLSIKAKWRNLTYQWFKDGVLLREGKDGYHGVTSSTLSVIKASFHHNGEYHCLVSNEGGQVYSQIQTLFVGECYFC